MNGMTPLHIAAQMGHINVVKLLVAHTNNPNVPNTLSGKTPIEYATKKGHKDIVEFLQNNP